MLRRDTNGMIFWAGSTLNYDLYLDDIRLSNSRTVEYNALTGASTGQIAAQYTFDGSFPGYTERWYHYDRLGSVMNLTDTSANVVASYDQDAYGNTISNMTTGQWASSISGRHLTTKEADADAGLYYFWARWYDSRIGLFQSKDPLVYYNGYQAYRYCLNSPLAYFDPLGLMHFPYGDGELCTDGGCKKECTDGFKSKPEDSNPGDPLEDVPEPGKCTSSDGVYIPSPSWGPNGDIGGIKIPNNCICVINCDSNGVPNEISCLCTGLPGVKYPEPFPPEGPPNGWPKHPSVP